MCSFLAADHTGKQRKSRFPFHQQWRSLMLCLLTTRNHQSDLLFLRTQTNTHRKQISFVVQMKYFPAIENESEQSVDFANDEVNVIDAVPNLRMFRD